MRDTDLVDENIALRLETRANEASKQLLRFIEQSEIVSNCYSYKCRTKTAASLCEKKTRKRAEKPSYTLGNITDVIGLRIVTLFRRDMPDVFMLVLKAIEHMDCPTPNPFRINSLEEIIIYSNNPQHNEIVPKVRDVYSRHSAVFDGVDVQSLHSAAGYSSIHMISRLDFEVDNVSGVTDYYIPIEVQIRTVFEDAWGEIDHKYGYIIKTGKDIGAPIRNAEFVMAHLKILKQFADACAEYADVIYNEANPCIVDTGTFGQISSITADEDVLKKLGTLSVDQLLLDRYVKAIELKESAAQTFKINHNEGLPKYMQAAEGFRKIIDEYDCGPENREQNCGPYLFYYYVKMNEAICLMTTKNNDNIRKAYSIYVELDEFYSDFPLLAVRLGQSLIEQGYVDQAINKFFDAKARVEAYAKDIRKGVWSDNLPKADYEYIQRHLGRKLGYCLWKKSSSAGDKSSQLEFLQQAYVETKIILESIDKKDDDYIQTHNNLLYYAIEYLDIEKKDVFSQTLTLKVSVHIKILESNIEIPTYEDIETLDTLAKAYFFFCRYDKVCEVCDRVFALSFDPKFLAYENTLKFDLAQRAFALKQRVQAHENNNLLD